MLIGECKPSSKRASILEEFLVSPEGHLELGVGVRLMVRSLRTPVIRSPETNQTYEGLISMPEPADNSYSIKSRSPSRSRAWIAIACGVVTVLLSTVFIFIWFAGSRSQPRFLLTMAACLGIGVFFIVRGRTLLSRAGGG